MSRVIDGIFKAAFEPGMAGLAAGGLLGFGLSRGDMATRLGAAALGATLGEGIASGAAGLLDEPDTSGLTAGEIAVMREEAEHQERWRNLSRIMAAGGGVASALLLKSPAPLLAAIPAATIAPIGHDARRLRRMGRQFRDARRSS